MANRLKFDITRDINDNLAYGTKFAPSIYQYQVSLSAGAEQTLIVPEGIEIALFSYSSPTVWVGTGLVPITVPPGTFTQTTAVLNHGVKEVTAGETLRFISSIVAQVGIVFFTRVQ